MVVIVVLLNVLLFYVYYSPDEAPLTPALTPIERTNPPETIERTHPTTTMERTRPVEATATSTATAFPSASPSAGP